jgi:uncharacterized protein
MERMSAPTSERSRACAAVGLLAVVVDLILVQRGEGADRNLRLGVAGVAVGLLYALSAGDRRRIGLVLRPRPSLAFWLRFGLLGALVLAVLAGLVLWIAWSVDAFDAVPKLSPAEFPARFAWSVGWTPLFEEGIYRLALCGGLVAAQVGRTTILALSGLTFGALHFLYGNPAPDNLLAGFLLAWAYLKSGTAWVPVAMHAVGNAIIITSHRVAWGIAQ